MLNRSEPKPYQAHDFLPPPIRSRFSGIYAIINRDNLKIYIGSAVVLSYRWNSHRHDLWKNQHNSIYLQRAFNKNPNAFYIELIEELPTADKDTLLKREQFWIDFYQSHLRDNGYNISPNARSCQGVVRSQEFIQKVSKALSRPWSEERKQRWKEIRKQNQPRGWKWSLGQKQKHSLVHIGIKWKPGQHEKVRASLSSNPKGYNKKAVLQLSLSGQSIKRFQSVQEAEIHFGKRTNIHAVCKGKRPMALGFKWKYA